MSGYSVFDQVERNLSQRANDINNEIAGYKAPDEPERFIDPFAVRDLTLSEVVARALRKDEVVNRKRRWSVW